MIQIKIRRLQKIMNLYFETIYFNKHLQSPTVNTTVRLAVEFAGVKNHPKCTTR
jgi:hypothetical protein